MDSNQILTITVFVIVITIVGTIALAVVGYMAFRLRERKHPSRPGLDHVMAKPYFFERVRIPGVMEEEPGQSEPEPESARDATEEGEDDVEQDRAGTSAD